MDVCFRFKLVIFANYVIQMPKYFLVLCMLYFSHSIMAQKTKSINSDDGVITNGRMLNDTLNQKNSKVIVDGKTHYTDYKIINFEKDTTFIDTTLTLKKERVFNYIRKNTFELMSLHNIGQTFNRLAYDFNQPDLFPDMGMRAKYFNYFHPQDVDYYKVPTPTTELFFQTGIQEGHILNSMLTMNLSPQFNLSVSYKGLRSLGNYRNALASNQNLRLTASYTTTNHKYVFRTNYTGQNIFNQENGGLTENSIQFYNNNNKVYTDRERLETNFTNADSRLKTRSFYLEHAYNLWYFAKDSMRKQDSYWQFGHEFTHQRKFYTYKQTRAEDFFGASYSNKIYDSTFYFKTDQSIFTELKSGYVLGKLRVKANYSTTEYGYNAILFLNNQTIPNNIEDNNFSLHALWNAQFKTFKLNAATGNIFKGRALGNYLTGTASYSLDSLFTIKATLLLKSQSPNLNMHLYQSNYLDYNWYASLSNERTRLVNFAFLSDKWLDIETQVTQKDNYTYFNQEGKPIQYSGNLFYFKAKAHKEFRYRKFALDNTVMYQKPIQGAEVLHVPEFVSENTLYFSSDLFKRKPLYLQTGITIKYFSQYYADEFNPLINEFMLQNMTQVGNYPLVDFFANARIQRTRLYFKLENISSLVLPGKYWVTPTQPYRDFSIRFGLVWNFFI